MTAIPAPIKKDSVPVKPHSRKLKGPLWLWIAVVAILVGLLGWYVYGRLHPADDLGTLILGKAQKGDLIEAVSASGSVEPQTGAQVHIGAQLTGRIKHVYTDVGKTVKAGDVIAVLDVPEVEAAYTQSKLNYTAATSKLQQAQEALVLGKSQTYNAIDATTASLTSSKQAVDSASASERLQAAVTPTDIEKARAALGVANAGLDSAQATLEQTQLGAKLNIASAQQLVDQTRATFVLNQATYNRQVVLYKQGFVSPLIVDTALQAQTFSQSALNAALAQLDLTKQKVAADLKTTNSLLVQAQRVVESAKSALKAAQAEVYATAAKQADLGTAMAASKVASANLNTAVGNLTTNSINTELVKQALQAQKVALEQQVISQAEWDRSFIRTPIKGTVIQLAAQQGETVAASLAAPTLIVVADLSRLEVEAYVDETDIGKIKLGQPATVSVDAFPDRKFTGTVSKIAAGSTIQVGVITYDVTVAIQDPKMQLRPDMSATTTIETGRLHNALLVPAVAIQATLNGSFVKVLMVKDGKKQVVTVPVKVGGTDGVNVAILSGLKDGDQIVLAGAKASSSSGGSKGASAFGGGGGGGRGR